MTQTIINLPTTVIHYWFYERIGYIAFNWQLSFRVAFIIESFRRESDACIRFIDGYWFTVGL